MIIGVMILSLLMGSDLGTPSSEVNALKSATAAGSMQLEMPVKEWLQVAEIPKMDQVCRSKPSWGWSVGVQIVCSMLYITLSIKERKSERTKRLGVIAVLAYFVFTAIGCSCSKGGLCAWYYLLNVGVLGLGCGWVYRHRFTSWLKCA